LEHRAALGALERGKAMTRRSWWWIGLLLLVGAVGGCDDHDHHHHHHRDCGKSSEAEPNDTPRTADFLGEAFRGDCAIVVGSLSDPKDVDTYRFLVQERLTLAVTLDHSTDVNVALQFFDADTDELIQDCGSGTVPIVCEVRFAGHAHDIAVDAVVASAGGTGAYTLTLDTR
jgi:hypothetical protein